jgi:mannose-6-phosphate isomerase-like protein (cupin superfamily)
MTDSASQSKPNQPLILPPIIQTAESAPAYWFLGILWIILVDGEQTDGRYSLMEQLMPQDVGPAPHVHPFNDEGFYVMEGAMDMRVGDRTISANPGTSVWIPRKTVHAFKVTTPTCRVLNSFAPAGMEQLIKSLARPADRYELPPPELKEDPKKIAAFANNYWGMEIEFPVAQTTFSR